MLMRRTLLRRASSWTFPSLYDQSAMSGKKEKFCRLSTPRKNNRQVKGHFQELFLIYDRNHLIPAASASMMPPIRPPAACGRGADAWFPLRAFRTGAVFLLNLRTEQRADTAARKRKRSFRGSREPRARTKRCSGACRPCTPAGPCRIRKGRHNATRPYSSAFPARGKARNLLRRGGEAAFPPPALHDNAHQ